MFELNELREDLIQGKFDDLIFSVDPEENEELRFLIEKDNRSFMQHLFAKCQSNATLEYWLKKGAKLTEDAVALAVALRSDKVIFKYLLDHKYFEDISQYDKDELLRRASRLEKGTFDYLKQECLKMRPQ